MHEWTQSMQTMNNFEQFPLAMAYVPWQKNASMYENLDEAYNVGTIFPDLYKPFLGRSISR
jgi:hypothetical protein